MIKVTFYKYKDIVLGFKALNHGASIVCAAVSILTQNTVNSVNELTQAVFKLEHNEDGGYMEFIIKSDGGNFDSDALLLMSSLYLGIKSIEAEYGSEVRIFFKEVPNVKN